jgi:hypothetical protein
MCNIKESSRNLQGVFKGKYEHERVRTDPLSVADRKGKS